MLVCMVMQIASVFPHHHHSELFCLHADLATCAGEDCNTAGMHHEGDGDRHTCTVGCVTLLHLVYMPEATLLSDGMYIENLHTQDVACNTGLRAPPVC